MSNQKCGEIKSYIYIVGVNIVPIPVFSLILAGLQRLLKFDKGMQEGKHVVVLVFAFEVKVLALEDVLVV